MRRGGEEEDEGDEEEEGRRVPSGQTTPDGASVLPTDRFLQPRLPRMNRMYYQQNLPRNTKYNR